MSDQTDNYTTLNLEGSVINGITIQEHDRVELIPTPLKKNRPQKIGKNKRSSYRDF